MNNQNKDFVKRFSQLSFDVKEYSIEELYASWIRNALIILIATFTILHITISKNNQSLIYRICIFCIIITNLMLLISSTIDYRNRIMNLYKDKIKEYVPNIYNISLACIIIWILIGLLITFITVKE